MFSLASATVITELTSSLSAYTTAAFTLVAGVVAATIGLKWVKGWSSKAS